MKKQINKYPFNARIEDEIKVFLSDQIGEQVVSITCRNGQFFCLIKDKITHKKKEIAVSAVLFFCPLVAMPNEARPIGLPPMIPSAPEVHRSAPQHFHQHAPAIESKVDKIRLTNDQIKQFNNLALQLNNGSIKMEEVILQLRGGDGLTDVAAVIVFVIFFNWYDSLFGVKAFQPNPLPHQDPLGWLSGKYDSRNAGNPQCQSNPPSRFERETLYRMKQMCAASADENGFVMNYDEAHDLIKETYGGSMQITEDCKITDWQGAKKAYHFQKGFGIDLGKYQNISKEDLVSLQNTDGGLIPYVQKGGKLPPIELIRDSQQKIYDFCHLENTEINRYVTHYGKNTGETPCIMFFNRETRQIALFNKTSSDLITAEKFRQNYFTKCIDSGQVGKPTN